MKTDEGMAQKNIEISVELSRYLFEHPEFEATLPAEAEIILLPELDSQLSEYNQALGREIDARGEKVVYIRLGLLRPKALSRIESLAIGS